MLALETDPQDNEAINAVFRPFHSIKGVAGFLNLKDIHHLSHEVENLLDAARSGTLVISDGVIDIVLNAVDILKVLLGELEQVQNQEAPKLKASPLVAPFLDRVRNFGSEDPVQPGTPHPQSRPDTGRTGCGRLRHRGNYGRTDQDHGETRSVKNSSSKVSRRRATCPRHFANNGVPRKTPLRYASTR